MPDGIPDEVLRKFGETSKCADEECEGACCDEESQEGYEEDDEDGE